MATTTPIQIPLAIEARAALINGQFTLSDDQLAFMKLVRERMGQCAADIVNALPAGQYDVGRVIAGLDAMQQAKDVLCAAAILPAYRKPVAELTINTI